jgi:hypothetical protein
MKRGISRSGLQALVGVVSAISVSAWLAWAGANIALADTAPDCLGSNGQSIGVDNNQVLQWETSTPNQFLARAHVSGTIVQLYPDHSGHNHFAIQIGPGNTDLLEIVYNQDFGNNLQPSVGDQVEACGDYITSTQQAGPYPASPCNAILHWVHESDTPKHPSGFLMINGQLYGYDPGGGSSDAGSAQVAPEQQNADQPYCSRSRHKRHEC